MKKTFFSIAALMFSLSFSAYAIPHEDCTAFLTEKYSNDSVQVTSVMKVDFATAVNMIEQEGLFQGSEQKPVIRSLENAKQIYAVYASSEGGSATYLVGTDRVCKNNEAFKIQED